MNILIKFPTRGRHFKFFHVLDLYMNKVSEDSNVKFLITLDEDDLEMNNPVTISKLEQYPNLTYKFGVSKTKIEAINRDMNDISEWDILILASDDMIPVVNRYDQIIRSNMTKFFPDRDGVLFFNDGYVKSKVNTFPIVGKKYFDRFNYIYHPEYLSTYCDNEFTDVANILNKQRYFDLVLFRHEHPDHGYGKRDFVHHRNFHHTEHDSNLYVYRKSKNFDL